MSEKAFKVFLCSTYSDLINERALVLRVIQQLQLLHSSMEFFGARPETPLATVLEEVRESDIVVVIIGYRYGTLVPGRRVSYTEAEYEEAWKIEKPCLVYIRLDNLPILPLHIDRDSFRTKALENFKKLLRSRHLVASYAEAEDLALSFAVDIERTLKTLKREPKPETMDSTLSLLDFLNTPSFLCDTNDLILDVNQTLTKVLGYSSSEMVGKPIHVFTPNASHQPKDKISYLADKGVRYIDLEFKKKTGGSIYLELDIHKYELSGKVTIQCVTRDITERKKTEEALRLSEANLREKSDRMENLLKKRTQYIQETRKGRKDNTLDEIMSQTERAYSAYMDAERQVTLAYHENELQVAKSYKRAELASMDNLEKSLAQAKIIRDEALQKPLSLYQEIINNYDETIKQALATYKDNISKSWIVRSETVKQAWEIYFKLAR